MATDLRLGDITGLLQFAKAAGGSIVTDFPSLFARIKDTLKSFNQLTPEISANLDLAQQALAANPGLFDVGKATFVSSIDALLAKYPASTFIKDIPELGGGTSAPPASGNVTIAPSALIYSFFNGSTPDPQKLAELAAFAKSQYESYKAQGVARPELGPYEAIGRGFAETIGFETKYGKLTVEEFVRKAYSEIFERAPTSEQAGHFKGQVGYFETLYVNANLSAAQALKLAMGAVSGQMLGVAATDEVGKHAYITAATKGLSASSSAAVGITGLAAESAPAELL